MKRKIATCSSEADQRGRGEAGGDRQEPEPVLLADDEADVGAQQVAASHAPG